MPRFVVWSCLVALAAAAGAQMSEELRSWADSPVKHLLSREEQREFRALRTDEEAERFIALFWARRDPVPATPANELREEFEKRVAAADQQFGYDDVRGAFTDRGQALILLGAPVGRTSQAARAGLGADARLDTPGAADIWTYERETLKVGIPSSQLHLVFRESRPSRNDFSLDRTSRDNRMALRVLSETPRAVVVRPDLREAPQAGLVPGSAPATAAELEALAGAAWPEGAWAVAVPGVHSREIVPAWVYLRLPEGAPAGDRLVGRVSPLGGGAAAGTFAVAAAAEAAAGGRTYQLAIPLAPGSWRIELALLALGRPVAVRGFDVTADAAADRPWISPLYWGGEVREDRTAALGAPFNVGGWRVVPRPADEYAPGGSLEVFGAVVGPSLADGKARVELSMVLRKDGRTIQNVPAEVVDLSQVRGDVWMHGRSVPLAGFRGAGAYELEVTVRDPLSNTSRTTTIPLRIGQLAG